MSVKYRSSPFYTEVKFTPFSELGNAIKKIPNCKVFIIDENVYHLYGELLQKLIGSHPFVTIKAAETNKTFEHFSRLVGQLSEWNINRNDSVVAIGGGITLDLAGFAASVFKRGCRLVFVPTTFVAMVDAAIGGKNGVNQIIEAKNSHNEADGMDVLLSPFPFTGQKIPAPIPSAVKNLLGTFYPANQVIVSTGFLESLNNEDVLNGWAEAVKISLLIPNKLYDLLLTPEKKISKEIIRRAIILKEKLCRNDLYDRTVRRKLNLGHTFAHLIEAASLFEISHGKAVAIGIRCAAVYSLQKGRIDETVYRKIIKPLDILGFPKALPEKYHANVEEHGEIILQKDKKKNSILKIVVFSGFQNTRVISLGEPKQAVKTLLSLEHSDSK